MLAEERREKIMIELSKYKIVKAIELAKKYNVGIETIRRDFDSLEKQGNLKKIYGGAIINEKNEIKDFEHNIRINLEVPEKIEIARKAIKLIEEDDTIFLNDSSTNIYLANEIKENIKKITVITNSLIIASELSTIKEYNIILAGGFLDSNEKAFFGKLTEEIISQFIVNKAFISVSNVSLKDGITDFPLKEVEIQKLMIEHSKNIIILANSKKFETSSLIKVNDLINIKTIITDSKLSEEIKNSYIEKGINII